ncbi:hypothetical protein ACQCT3_17910 [Sutcliffiella horikoshii]|uniref:hypothetical protein n=1 Tax=Sutcliffiella horikoshii TaxID=79883 RepID=UPI003CF6F723
MNFSFDVQEVMFVAAVTHSCLTNDQTKVHYLLESHDGMKKYLFVPALVSYREIDLINDKILCKFDHNMIQKFHIEAGNDGLSVKWLEGAIQQVINGQEVMSKERVASLYSQ